MEHFMTPEEAHDVQLSLNPFRRSKQVREIVASLGLREVGISLTGSSFMGRHTLVDLAESYERAVSVVEGLRAGQINE